jgi:hypothetical protein
MRSDGSDLMSRTNHPAFNAAPDWQPLDDDDEENDGDDDRASDGRESGPVAMRARSPIVYFAVFDAVPVGESAVPVAFLCGRSRSSGSGRQPVFLHDSSVARTDISGPR